MELFYFEGLCLREIGARLDRPVENVRHHYYWGLKKLQESAIEQTMRRFANSG
ncbi:MAG: hypothetical protein ACR2NN_24735 [Bryobacteraceae bacterium]